MAHGGTRRPVVVDVAEHAEQHDRHRLADVQGARRRGQHRGHVAQVGLDVADRALRGAGLRQQCLGVQDHRRVVVGVDDAAVRRDALHDLVRVPPGRQPGADVEELPHPRRARQEAQRADTKGALGPRRVGHVRELAAYRVAGRPVSRKEVPAAQPVVPDPGRMGRAHVQPGRRIRPRPLRLAADRGGVDAGSGPVIRGTPGRPGLCMSSRSTAPTEHCSYSARSRSRPPRVCQPGSGVAPQKRRIPGSLWASRSAAPAG
jgi:hypothetical protein